MRLPSWIAHHLAALRALLVLTVLTGILYPLVMIGVAQIPGLQHKADGSLVTTADGKTVGSAIIGQLFTDKDGNPLTQYFQSRPSAAGDGYDPTATSASNLGPESVVDTLPDPAIVAAGKEDENAKQSLLTQVCSRSKAVGALEGVDGSRPFCTPDGVGAVLAVFHRDGLTGPVTRVVSLNEACPATPFVGSYDGVTVECAKFGEDYSHGIVTPVRGDAKANPAVPADAVTASGSGLDPDISPAYAKLQAPRVAKARGTTVDAVLKLVDRHTDGRALGFMGEPGVNVLELNLDLDRKYPYRG
jgi:K+-transporting ATPase ATPase C chain